MAKKKIDKVFVLSDSSINVYGFRLLTSGCLLDEVRKNPIGYYGHEKEDGILLTWEDLHVDGDAIKGKPVINMEHPRAERTVAELEDGTLKAASVGHICVIEHVLEDNPADLENPTVVATKWYYKECSLVDSPGNRNAFAELYDANDEMINLSDLTKDFIKQTKTSDMKEVVLKITPQLVSILSLSDEPDAKEMQKAIKDLHDRATKGDEAVAKLATAQTELNDLKDAQIAGEVSGILQKGLDDKKLTVALKDVLGKQYAKDPAGLKAVVDAMPKFESLVDAIGEAKGKKVKDVKDLRDMSYEDLDKAGKLEDLRDNDFDAFNAKFKVKFGRDYK